MNDGRRPPPSPTEPAPAPAADTGPGAARRPGAPALPVLRSEDVLAGHRAVEIVHGGLRYRLSVTAMGKLILTK